LPVSYAHTLLAAAAVLAFSLAPTSLQDAGDLRERAKAALSQTSGQILVTGLQQPVEVIRDRWGVPHIYAKTVEDLFFAQGFVAAETGCGSSTCGGGLRSKLAEILGPAAINRDTFARLLRYRGDPRSEWQGYGPGARAIVDAFVRGINAQIAIATSQPEKLPIEFQLVGSRPEPWTSETVISRMAGYIMTRNARTEVQRARLARTEGTSRVAALMPLDPPTVLTVPDGLDLADIGDSVLSLTAGASEAVDFSPLSKPREPSLEELLDELSAIGSNDWVVSGARTATGKPLLANDPHRSLLLPSLRYTVHLNGPGWNVIGAGEPALPGVAAGHNDRIAFGFTIVGIDQQDLYVEHLDTGNPDRYLYRGSWEPMRIERERLAVRGGPPREIELRFTRHGAVLHVDPGKHRAYALRWVGSEPGAAGYLRSLVLDRASNWKEFLDGVEGWKVPSENLVYADVDGNIGWIAAGLAPVRPNWDGLLPVPAQDGRYEWSGFLKAADLPQVFNPTSGFVATANHNILPPGYSKILGYEFSAPYRFLRITEVLRTGVAAGKRFAVADFERLQHDELSVVARAVVGALMKARDSAGRSAAASDAVASPKASQAAAMLAGWNCVLAKESAAAALYEAWLPRLTRAFSDALAPEPAGAAERMTTDRLLAVLGQAGLLDAAPLADRWVDGSLRPGSPATTKSVPDERIRRLAIEVLTGPVIEAALDDTVARMGPDPGAWAWGRIHRVLFEHPLAFTTERKAVLNLPDAARGGDGTTPNATGAGARQTAGASYREVIDLADWDRSTTINVPGASGQAESPHYADLLPLWADGRYHPLVFSREAVERHAGQRLLLVPAKGLGR
jgi:penicillin amidase